MMRTRCDVPVWKTGKQCSRSSVAYIYGWSYCCQHLRLKIKTLVDAGVTFIRIDYSRD